MKQCTDVLYRISRLFVQVRLHCHPYVGIAADAISIILLVSILRSAIVLGFKWHTFFLCDSLEIRCTCKTCSHGIGNISKAGTVSLKSKEPYLLTGESCWYFWKTHALPDVVLYDTYLKQSPLCYYAIPEFNNLQLEFYGRDWKKKTHQPCN